MAITTSFAHDDKWNRWWEAQYRQGLTPKELRVMYPLCAYCGRPSKNERAEVCSGCGAPLGKTK